MHNHDPDIIAALAEGTLSPTEERAVLTGVEGCTSCSADLALQRSALDAIRSAEAPALTAEESTLLRASIAEAIGLPAPVPEVAGRRRRIPWPAISIAAASLAAIIAVVPVMGLLNTSADDSGEDAVAAMETVTSMAALEADEESTARDSFDAAPPGDAELAPSAATESAGGDGMATAAEPTTTAAAYATALTAMTVEDLQVLIDDRIRIGTLDLSYDEACRGAAAEQLGGEVLQPAAEIDVDGVAGKVFLVITEDGAVERAVVLAISDCSVLFMTP